MKKIRTALATALLALLLASCNESVNPGYSKELENWKISRLERLKSKTGWLNLAGLYWLKEGVNTFGSDTSNSIQFPSGSKPFYGSILNNGDTISLIAAEGANILAGGEIVYELILQSDDMGNPTLMESDNFAWFIIKRDGKYAIRLRDYSHPRIEKLTSIPSYPIENKWIVEAELHQYDTVRIIETTTVTGGVETNECPGELVFRKGLKQYKLYPFQEGKNLFIIFADKTNGIETYGNGRYMSAVLPDSGNTVILDFNRAYNPPCAFSPFATCPMPPRENMLDLEVKAGERAIETDFDHH